MLVLAIIYLTLHTCVCYGYELDTHTHTHINSHTPSPTGNVETGKKEVVFSGHRKGIEGVVGHKGHVMGITVSSDGKFLVSYLKY